MKKARIKVPAKINLTLDIIGTENGYHNINSLVASINLFDAITLYKRKDKAITITETGKYKVGEKLTENNAYITAKRFMEKYNTDGVDIVINKNIPIGGGLGGSSADIVGVLKCMQVLYNVDKDVKELAITLGSDTAYMLNGGYACISGRGEKVVELDIKKQLYLLLITEEKSISAKDSYLEFDKLNMETQKVTKSCAKYLLTNDVENFCLKAKNDLFYGSSRLVDNLAKNGRLLEKADAKTTLMTGSGSVMYGIYLSKKERDKGYKKLIKLIDKEKIIKAKTI